MDNESRGPEPAYGIRTTGAGTPGGSPYAFPPAEAPAGPDAEPVGTSLVTRLLGYLVALLLGALFGVLGTIVHQITFSVAGLFDLPIGLAIALPAELLLLIGLRMSFVTRLPAVLAGVGLVGMTALLALPSPGGSVLIPEGVLGYCWLLGSTLVAVVVLAWPRLGGARSATK